ncbi:uncharacterized protein [Atheta coriaria]|uniref:uncharacterized protein n=1 Tax=Dalotia coriaria TaxID=877792 RepID=UPI0031F3AB5C
MEAKSALDKSTVDPIHSATIAQHPLVRQRNIHLKYTEEEIAMCEADKAKNPESFNVQFWIDGISREWSLARELQYRIYAEVDPNQADNDRFDTSRRRITFFLAWLHTPAVNSAPTASSARAEVFGIADEEPKISKSTVTDTLQSEPGSELSLITENAVQQIGIRNQSARAEVFGIADEEPKISKSMVTDTLLLEPLDFNTFKLWENRPLADPYLFRPGNIDILLDGLEKPSGYMAQNSERGWHKSPQISAQVCTVSGPQPDLTRFWELEEVECSIQPTAEAENCEVWYKESTTRSKDGRYTVCLPFKEFPPKLGESRSRALARFLQLEKKMRCNAKLREDYHTFMREYLELHRMRKVNKRDSQLYGYYIPHRAVIKEESCTTKLRVVFNASCQTSSKLSLNECMYVGPQLQNDIADLLLRWRKHTIVCTADYTMVIDIIKKDFYVDDVLSGAEDLKTAKKLQLDLLEVMKKGGFTLRKWSSKLPGLIEDLPKELIDQSTYDVGSSETKKTLGTTWDPQEDTIMVRINRNVSTKITKRSILSDISKIFDPLGWLSPVIIIIKLQILKLWSDKIDWDENLNEENTEKWQLFCRQLPDIESIQLQRWVSTTANMEQHGFCDASEKAYGAVVYCRSPNGGKTYINVLQAKSKVAPVKTQVSLPRLELCAAKIVAALLRKLRISLDISNENIYAWSDSMITLAWITGPVEKREVFVANRIVDVNRNIPTHAWRHVRTHENPADLITRGVAPNKLKENKLWWQGPTWLTQEKETWPTQPMIRKVISTPATINILMVKPNSSIINRFSSLHKMLRVLTYCQRFRTRDKDGMKYAEMESTMQAVIRLVQQEGFADELKALTTGSHIAKASKIKSLIPFVDPEGVIRVGGRLENSQLKYNRPHPILIPSNHHVAKLIIQDAHYTTLHGGNETTLAFTRRKFWIPRAKETIYRATDSFQRIIKAEEEIVRAQEDTVWRTVPSHASVLWGSTMTTLLFILGVVVTVVWIHRRRQGKPSQPQVSQMELESL